MLCFGSGVVCIPGAVVGVVISDDVTSLMKMTNAVLFCFILLYSALTLASFLRAEWTDRDANAPPVFLFRFILSFLESAFATRTSSFSVLVCRTVFLLHPEGLSSKRRM